MQYAKRRAKVRTTRPDRGTMNKTEAAYNDYLHSRHMAGEVSGWAFEAMTLRLADRTTYTPDFVVFLADGRVQCHEVKAITKSGRWLFEDDARVKLKVAAEAWWMFEFVAAGCVAKANGGGWEFEYIGGATR